MSGDEFEMVTPQKYRQSEDKPKTYSWSLDEERYHGEFLTRDEAIYDAMAEDPPEVGYGRSVWTGVAVEPTAAHLVRGSATYLIDNFQEQAFEEAGTVTEEWLNDVSKEQEEDLERRVTAIVREWMIKHGFTPKWWAVEDTELCVIGHEDFQELSKKMEAESAAARQGQAECEHPWHNGSLILESCPRCLAGIGG